MNSARLAVTLLAIVMQPASSPGADQRSPALRPDSLVFSQVVNGHTETVTYRGRPAVKLVPSPETAGKDLNMLAILAGRPFKDGTIDIEMAGAPRPGMPADSRGFIGLAFRAGPHGEWSEVFYLRPTNGRSEDQLRRNHSVQYVSDPEYPWYRLRKEAPGVYESSVDLEPGAWTAVRIVVTGTTARLYVNHAAQPSLVVTDLKRGDIPGQIALWAHVETDAYFGALTVSPAGQAPKTEAAITLDSTTRLESINGRALWVNYRGRRALKLAPLEGHEHDTDQEMMAVLTESDFQDGVIELDVSGARREGYSKAEDVSGFKGIVGLTFRLHGDTAERFYLRPENTRLDNQLFRNRSTQYESSPDFPWQRLREQSPGVYESYADVEPGAWTRLRIEVSGSRARLYVNGATQPSLVVNDLKHGESRGRIALWARISSEAYFSNLRVEPR